MNRLEIVIQFGYAVNPFESDYFSWSKVVFCLLLVGHFVPISLPLDENRL